VKLGCLLLISLRLTVAQQPFADQLLQVPDESAIATLLDANPSAITSDLFEICRKSAQLHLDHRENADALLQFKIALALAHRLQSDRSIALAARGLGIAYRRLDQQSAALAAYQEGLAAAIRTTDPALQADLLRGLGVAHRALGEFPQAIEADERSIALYRELHDAHQTAAGLNNLATTYSKLGDLRRSGELFEEVLSVGKDFPDVVNSATGNLALVAAGLGNRDVARAYLERANQANEKTHDWHVLAGGLINLGDVYLGDREYDKALASFNRGAALALQTNDFSLYSAALINRASLYSNFHHPTLAIADLEESVRINQDRDVKEYKSTALSNLAWLELKTGQNEKAFAHAEQAANLAANYQTPEVQWQAFDALGRCYIEKHDSVKAKEYLEKSIASVELLRSRSEGGEVAGYSALESRIAAYHDLLRLELNQGRPEQALSLAERAKARQLLDVVRQGKTQPAAYMTADETAQEQKLSATLSQLDQQLFNASDPKTLAEIQKRLALAQRRMNDFRMQLYLTHPGLAAQRGDAAPITLHQSTELLPDNQTALVEFTSSEDTLYIFSIVRRAGTPILRTHQIHWPREQLNHDVDEFLNKVAARNLDYRPIAQRLYQRLFTPLASELSHSKLLVIVPDGPLWNLPFQTLIGPDQRYLVEKHAVFYTPSLTYLRETRRNRSAVPPNNASHQLLALGNPDSAALPETAREVNELGTLYGTAHAKLLLGSEASKASWQRDAPKYGILHIATHGILNPGNPMYSYLLFSGKTDSEKTLEAREVLNMNLHSDLVVLSACETGRGRVAMGEGLVGMSWAFLLAGAPTTVVSQWRIDSASTTQLMINMHTSLQQVFAAKHISGRARSLQQAALTLMQTPEYRHPFYWAGFVMVGDGY